MAEVQADQFQVLKMVEPNIRPKPIPQGKYNRAIYTKGERKGRMWDIKTSKVGEKRDKTLLRLMMLMTFS